MEGKRLGNPLPDDEYQVARSNWQWNDHILRTFCTAAAIAWLNPKSICDPACGDGSIVREALNLLPWQTEIHLNDISRPNTETIEMSPWFKDRKAATTITTGSCYDNIVKSEVIVLTEILEHLEDPLGLLKIARSSGARNLIASSPIDEQVVGGNHEHVWGWTANQYLNMLQEAGWNAIAYQELRFWPKNYDFQLWICQ